MKEITNLVLKKEEYSGILKRISSNLTEIIHYKEQFIFRAYICIKCIENKKCDNCSCNVYDSISDILSCNNKSRFPNLMKKKDWDLYKKEHNIEII